jgi:hypothetical protein
VDLSGCMGWAMATDKSKLHERFLEKRTQD